MSIDQDERDGPCYRHRQEHWHGYLNATVMIEETSSDGERDISQTRSQLTHVDASRNVLKIETDHIEVEGGCHPKVDQDTKIDKMSSDLN